MLSYRIYNKEMLGLIIGFLASFITTLLIIRYKHLHSKLTGDHDISGPQKMHLIAVPRIGGISIAFGIFLTLLIHSLIVKKFSLGLMLLISSIPPFAIGLTEDITKVISVKVRLLFIAIGAVLAVHLTGGQVIYLDIPILDHLFGIYGFGFLFTVFAITGLSNAYNIIDGFNGLSSMVGIITLLGLGYVSYKIGDMSLMYLNLSMIAAVLGFFFWNYPRGLIFLGDGGAYLIGFWIAILSILIVNSHQEVSPWFAVLINAYPILETLFTIYRRRIYQGKNAGLADGMHFHTLIYRRILKVKLNGSLAEQYLSNSRTAPYLWLFSSLGTIPAILFYESTPILVLCTVIFISLYLWLYKKIITFKTPLWLHI